MIGGISDSGGYSKTLYKLKCQNGNFEWSEMEVQLKTPRVYFVTSIVPAI